MAVQTVGPTIARLSTARSAQPVIRRIGVADLGMALRRGLEDFGANRTDLLFLALVYPVVGLLLGRAASGSGMIPLLFPLASGFALIGPFAGVGLNEMSRRREQGMRVRWLDAFSVLRAPNFGTIALLGLLLAGILALWLATAQLIYNATMGDTPPDSLTAFARDVLTTSPGWTLIGAGVTVGFCFAVVTFIISVVSFPLLIDRPVGINTAVLTSLRAVATNPAPMALWAVIIAALLVAGSLPLFLGLIVVMPVLGHATWHLYRRMIV